jgi:asparagine synthase (glutamine-hydrolysing)
MPPEEAKEQLACMLGRMRHESFYVTGTWSDCSLGVYVGWTARQGSFSEAMPISNESGDRVLCFSGEEFPEPGIAERLKERGHSLTPEGPSYLVHLSEEERNFPASLNGRFHGLLADRARGIVTLFNDRYGMHRLYFHRSGDAFYFAAEAKAILAIRPELRTIDPRALGEFVSCGCVLHNRTLFPEIGILPPGSAWFFCNATLEQKNSYFDPKEWEQQEPLPPEAYYQEIREVFSRNLPRYFNGRERVAMSLTGGLDTRMVMAWHKDSEGSLPCYTFGGPYRDCQDVQIARQVAQECRQPHQVIAIGEDFLNQFPLYAERAVYLSDGCVDVTRSSDLYANVQAHGIAPVRMTGNYGTEVLRWLPAMKPVEPAAGLFDGDFLTHVRAAKQDFVGVIDTHPASFAVFRQAPWFHYGLLALEQTQVSIRSPYLDNDLVRSVFRAKHPAFPKSHGAVNNDVCLRLIADGNPALRALRTDRGVAGNESSPVSAFLRNYLEFTFRAEYAYDYGMPQWLARIDHGLAPLRLERLFLGRHKFAHYRLWYRDALSGYVREMLLDRRTLSRPYLNRSCVEDIVRGHLRGDRNYTIEIHKLLTLELIHRLFVDTQ